MSVLVNQKSLRGIYPLVGTVILLNVMLLVALALTDVNTSALNSPTVSKTALLVTVLSSIVLGALFVVWITLRRVELDVPSTRFSLSAFIWSVILSLPVATAIAFSPEAAYAALALYVIVLWLIPNPLGTFAVALLCVGVIFGQAVHHGWTVGGVLGPIVSAVAVIALLFGYRSIVRAAAQNAALVEKVQDMSAALARTEREAGRASERSRLGRDLHDTTAQHLSSIRLLLAAAGKTTEPERIAVLLQQANDLSSTALTEIRALVNDLTPPALQGETLPDALHRLVDDANSRRVHTGDTRAAKVTYVENGTRFAVITSASAALFRVCGEALTNALKHADAHTVAVRIHFTDSSLVLEIDDDGVGFDPEQYFVAEGHGHGISGMRSRLEELGGTLAVVSELNEGTLVRVELGRDRVEHPQQPSDAENQ